MKLRTLTAFVAFIITIFFYSGYCHSFSDTRFTDPTDKGNFGESITDQWMKSRGFESVPTKHAGNQGIDGCYVKRNPDGTFRDVRLVECKTDSSPYKPEQMSDTTINEQIEKMKKSEYPEVRKAGEELYNHKNKIKKEFHHHDTRSGKMTIYEIKPNGQLGGVIAGPLDVRKTQESILKEREKQKARANAETPFNNAELEKAKGTPDAALNEANKKNAIQTPPASTEPVKYKSEETSTVSASAQSESKEPGALSIIKEKMFNFYQTIRNKTALAFDKATDICITVYRNIRNSLSHYLRSTYEALMKFANSISESFTKLKNQVTHRLSSESPPTATQPGNNSQSQTHTDVKPDTNTIAKSDPVQSGDISKQGQSQQNTRVSGTSPENKPSNKISTPPVAAGQSSFVRVMNKLVKVSVAIGIVYSGYAMTKEVYEKKMQGVTVHPSRVLARGLVGFAGATAGGLALGGLAALLCTTLGPIVMFIVGFIASLLGAIPLGIGAEWLYEWIVPMDGLGWAIGDFLLGGLIGSLLGILPGMVIGLIVARVKNALTPAPKMLPKGNSLWKKVKNTSINGWRKFDHWSDKKSNTIGYAFSGVFFGFIFGGFFIATTFLYLFN